MKEKLFFVNTMGDTLTKPITEKHSTILENELLTVGATGMQVCLEGSSGEGEWCGGVGGT